MISAVMEMPVGRFSLFSLLRTHHVHEGSLIIHRMPRYQTLILNNFQSSQIMGAEFQLTWTN